ncbi:MAG: pyridoxal phosphate-dependent aminotransferase [Chitinophagaceae bacterium]|nr:MAG: pyridoxal phosphate-dependent aminotransferase [Chitinophagaceae bacterium]
MLTNTQLVNPNISGLKESATLAINGLVKDKRLRGELVYNMGLGQSPFPVPDAVVNALRNFAPQKDYLHVQGLYELREAISEFHFKKDSIKLNPENIIVGPGSKELLFLLQVAFSGDILLPSPCWVSYIPQAKIIGRKVSLIQTRFEDRWRITPELLDSVCNQRVDKDLPAVLILNYPGNPDGMTYSRDELKKLAKVARDNNIIILSDEIYGPLNHRDKHLSIARFYPEGTILSSGLSKWCGAGGWRLGSFSFPEGLDWLKDAMCVVASETFTSVSAPVQYAAIQAFKGGSDIERYLTHSRRILSVLGYETASILLKGGLKLHLPEGGFYHFVDFEPYRKKLAKLEIVNSVSLCNYMLEHLNVAALPGHSFARPLKELTVRMAYVDFDGTNALDQSYKTAISKNLDLSFCDTHCHNVLEGNRVIVKWLKSLS